jgi:nicotinate-nucleotide pyrophosphorylase (carboxylating)
MTAVDLVRAALAEDLADGPDITTQAIIPADAVGTADIIARAPGVVAGLTIAESVFVLVGGSDGSATGVLKPTAAPIVSADHATRDGACVEAGQLLLTIHGPLRTILTAERTALNFLCHLSGIATLTRAWVHAVAGTGAVIRDTRKTLPGLRALEKYAVRCGGGVNHRMSLSDAALIKDNHVAAAGSVAAALRAIPAGVPVEVECDTLDQVEQAVVAGAELILLDNFGMDDMKRAVALVAGRARLEASGGLRLESAAEVAATGVDYLAVGALTHSARALDIGLDLR